MKKMFVIGMLGFLGSVAGAASMTSINGKTFITEDGKTWVSDDQVFTCDANTSNINGQLYCCGHGQTLKMEFGNSGMQVTCGGKLIQAIQPTSLQQ